MSPHVGQSCLPCHQVFSCGAVLPAMPSSLLMWGSLACHASKSSHVGQPCLPCHQVFSCGAALPAMPSSLLMWGCLACQAICLLSLVTETSYPQRPSAIRMETDQFGDRNRDVLMNSQPPHKWWSTLKSAVFDSSSSLPPLVGGARGLV